MVEMYQMMDQVVSAGAPAQTAANRGAETQSQSKENSFDTMVRQKQQAGERKAPKDEAADGAAEKSAVPAKDQKEIPDEQMAMAAAMLFQLQPNVSFDAAETVAEEAAPELQELILANPVAAAEQTPEIAPETAETPAELPEAQTGAERTAEADLPRPELPEEPAAETAAEIAVPERRAEAFGGERTDGAQRERGSEERPDEEPRFDEEAPVFGTVEAAPIRVAEPAQSAEPPRAPVALEAEDGMAQLGARIENLVVDENGESSVELTLTPENLGTVRVEITRAADGALHIALSANSERAVTLLTRGTNELQNLLARAERPNVQVQVRGSDEAQQQFMNPDGQNGRNQQQQQQRRPQQQNDSRAEDFVQQLRLGLAGTDGE